MMICVSNSAAEPSATCRKWTKSFRVLRLEPSAILEEIETAALRICPCKAKVSDEGIAWVVLYISFANSIPRCHTFSSLKFDIEVS